MSNFRVDASAQGGVPVTPSDSVNIDFPPGVSFTKGIYIGVTGTLNVILADGSTLDYPNILAGVIHPISAKRVLATGTTVTGIRAQW